MIIRKSTVNNCIFTLSERTTLDPVNYLFELKCSQDESLKYFIAQDISPNKYSYNEFLIEETATENLLTGKISLPLLGGYTYRIFEQASSTNLDPAFAGGLVEIGRVDVIDVEPTQKVFTSTRTIKVFNA